AESGRLGESDPADPDSGRVGSVESADSNGVWPTLETLSLHHALEQLPLPLLGPLDSCLKVGEKEARWGGGRTHLKKLVKPWKWACPPWKQVPALTSCQKHRDVGYPGCPFLRRAYPLPCSSTPNIDLSTGGPSLQGLRIRGMCKPVGISLFSDVVDPSVVVLAKDGV
ncbi:hypothetical protein Taro_018950, partial [Colocasia esculenta]|nr:hypothetical protein [Colocasia esculenta]